MTLCVFACKVDKVFFFMQCVWADLMQKKNDTTTVPWSILQPYSQ